MEKIFIKYIFCESFSFEKGVWLGNFRFGVEFNHHIYNGFLYSKYSQSTPNPLLSKRLSFDNSFSAFNESQLKEIKDAINNQFDELFQQIKNTFITPRELHMPKPEIYNFKYNHDESNDNFWLFSFQITDYPTVSFKIEMELINNTWFYSLICNNGSIMDYKNTLQWEDNLFEEIINQIKLVPEIRYKFLYQKVKFKFKNKRR